MEISEVLKALADTNRLRILNLLSDHTLCVCDLEEILQLQQSNLSRHLAKLRQCGLVKPQKRGLFTYYVRLLPDGSYKNSLTELYQALDKDPAWKNDRRALAKREATGQINCSV